MSKSFKATWLGDQDPLQQSISFGGLTFVKGQAVDVPADHEFARRIQNNPMFSSEKDADVIESDAPPPVDPEAGTELAAAKAEADSLGIKLGAGNHKLETIRAKIAEHHTRLANV